MIYFDYAASSIKRKQLYEKMLENFENFDGNTESIHSVGRRSSKILEDSRAKIAEAIGAHKNSIVFTSGASESNNTILRNFTDKTILIGAIEHPSILEPARSFAGKLIEIGVDESGAYRLDELELALDKGVDIVALSLVNNETGVIGAIEEVRRLIGDRDVWFHIDAVQALGHIDIDVEKLDCDSMALSGHKLGALNGFGALYIRRKCRPLILGGDQEDKRRAGTSYLMGAYSMAEAIGLVKRERELIGRLKSYLVDSLDRQEIVYEINGGVTSDHIINLYFPFVKNDFLITYLDMRGICISAGSACRAGALEASHVISAMFDEDRAKHSVRFSFGFTNTFEDIDYTVGLLKSLYEERK